MKKEIVITGATVLNWIMILVLVVVPIGWIIAGVREGAIIIPEFFSIVAVIGALIHVINLKKEKNHRK